MSASAVSACSPPESRVSVCGFLPGGWATSSSPASRGSSDSTSCSSALPPSNRVENRSSKCLPTTSNAATEPLAPLLVEGVDGGAQTLDRLRQIVALGDELVAARHDVLELLVGAQIDGAEPLALLA